MLNKLFVFVFYFQWTMKILVSLNILVIIIFYVGKMIEIHKHLYCSMGTNQCARVSSQNKSLVIAKNYQIIIKYLNSKR